MIIKDFSKCKLVISPMAGVTDAPFRQVALANGADYGISEMITSQTDLWESEKTQLRLKSHFKEPKKIIQIAGASPEVIADAARNALLHNVDAIEINMGCPAKKVCNVLAGSALLQNELLVADILAAAVMTVNVPIYLKTRLGWNHDNKNILKIAQISEDCGVKSLAIHGRTRCDFYNGDATYDLIAEVKQRVNIPVFANGDITSVEKALHVLQYTEVDGLYIGRGALGKPWLFQEIRHAMDKTPVKMLTSSQIYNIIYKHIQAIHQHYGEFKGVRFARKHIKWYLQANPQIFIDSTALFAKFITIESSDDQLVEITNWFADI